ncbi:hypothetical protein XENTR_v10011660 [Xenopus tropicalis]|nr:hypothetical protein XENTR_v10011660 [Xenopus tropicalis]
MHCYIVVSVTLYSMNVRVCMVLFMLNESQILDPGNFPIARWGQEGIFSLLRHNWHRLQAGFFAFLWIKTVDIC